MIRHTSHHRKRRTPPTKTTLGAIKEAQRKVDQATGMLHCTILWAYEDGWTMGEIAREIRMSQATVFRVIRDVRARKREAGYA